MLSSEPKETATPLAEEAALGLWRGIPSLCLFISNVFEAQWNEETLLVDPERYEASEGPVTSSTSEQLRSKFRILLRNLSQNYLLYGFVTLFIVCSAQY